MNKSLMTLTLLSAATVFSGNFVSCSSGVKSYESVSHINTIQHNFCKTCSFLDKKASLFKSEDEDIADMLFSHEKRKVRLRVIGIKKHISNIELEEVFEEI